MNTGTDTHISGTIGVGNSKIGIKHFHRGIFNYNTRSQTVIAAITEVVGVGTGRKYFAYGDWVGRSIDISVISIPAFIIGMGLEIVESFKVPLE